MSYSFKTIGDWEFQIRHNGEVVVTYIPTGVRAYMFTIDQAHHYNYNGESLYFDNQTPVLQRLWGTRPDLIGKSDDESVRERSIMASILHESLMKSALELAAEYERKWKNKDIND